MLMSFMIALIQASRKEVESEFASSVMQASERGHKLGVLRLAQILPVSGLPVYPTLPLWAE